MKLKIFSKNYNKIPYKFLSNIETADNNKVLNLKHIGSSIYLKEDSTYEDFSGERAGIHYIRNVCQKWFSRNSSDQTIVIIPMSMHDKQQLIDDSPITFVNYNQGGTFTSILGLYTEESKMASFDFGTFVLTTENGTKNFSNNSILTDFKMDINGWLMDSFFLYAENALMEFIFNPQEENIINPLEVSAYKEIDLYFKYVDPSADYFDLHTDYKDVRNRIRVQKPKFLFSDDKITWYKWNTGTTSFDAQTITNGNYFTHSEFLTKANTFDEYQSITDAQWNTQFGTGNIYFLTAGFIPPIHINTSRLISDVNKFIALQRDSTRYYIIKGDV